MATNLFSDRESLDKICAIPDRIISVYSLEQHIWAEANSKESRKKRLPEVQTIDEFQLDPVRPFLNDLFRKMSAPYYPEKKDDPIGQGYWVQAEFGSGKSHLLCFLASLSLGDKKCWDIIDEKEKKAGRGKRESFTQFREGLEVKSTNGKKGIFVISKTLVGVGSGTVGMNDQGRRLSEYILDAAKEQIEIEIGKNLSLYPVELLADRFLKEDEVRYRNDLKKFLKDPRIFDEDQFENYDDFIREIQQNKSPGYKESCGNKLWRFYTEYLKVQPQIAAETEDILENLVRIILNEGYSGILIVLDEVSLFMKNRPEELRVDDEKTLVVLSNRLAKVKNLPLWTICAAQQAIEGKLGVKNIIADDRLKLVKLLEQEKDYYSIVLNRVRTIKNPAPIKNYYAHYKNGFTWPNSIGEEEFTRFFPFHKPALEVLRAITYELTTTRSAIHFMHQTLKHQIKTQGKSLIRLWELFDEAVRYEEDPSGVHAGLVAIKTKKELEYKAYEVCRNHIEGMTKGPLKVYRDKAITVVQTLFLYHIGKLKLQGLSPEDIANEVLSERSDDSSPDENIQHFENIADNLKKELRQIIESRDEDKKARYKFDPVFTGIDPRSEFQKARDEAEANQLMQKEAWEHLLALDRWEVKTRQMTLDLSSGIESIFVEIAKFSAKSSGFFNSPDDTQFELIWNGKQIFGIVGMRDLNEVAGKSAFLPSIETDATDNDFAVFVSSLPVEEKTINKILMMQKDPRFILWSPAALTTEEKDRLLDFAAYRKMVSDWQGKDSEDSVLVINWVSSALQSSLGKIKVIVDNCYSRGRIDCSINAKMSFRVAGSLEQILQPVVEQILNSVYESTAIKFDPPIVFKKEEAVKVINGIVRTGLIPRGAKPNQYISAAKNFGSGLIITKKSNENQLDTADNLFIKEMWEFIDQHLEDDIQRLKVDTIYKNFIGFGGPKNYGLSKRIVQIYLFCLVRESKIRIHLTIRSGLSPTFIDYSNIGDIEFNAKILDNLLDIQKMAAPENWEILRPFAEKLLNEEIHLTNDDAQIANYRDKLKKLFLNEKDESVRQRNKLKALFEHIKLTNIYEEISRQFSSFYDVDFSEANDIELILYKLKESFNYSAFDTHEVSQKDVDDLASRFHLYNQARILLKYETELRLLFDYIAFTFPDDKLYKDVRETQKRLKTKMKEYQEYFLSEIKLKTEILGTIPAPQPEKNTLGALIRDYTLLYSIQHDKVTQESDRAVSIIRYIIEGKEFLAFKSLEAITVLQPAISDSLTSRLREYIESVFSCQDGSDNSIKESLQTGVKHNCEFDVKNSDALVATIHSIIVKAESLFADSVNAKLEILLNTSVKSKLEQGKDNSLIAKVLACTSVRELKEFLFVEVLENDALVSIINRYLNKLRIKNVKISDFVPSTNMIENTQLDNIAAEFRKYLQKELDTLTHDKDETPVIHLEK